jgi:uncharacterized protein with FMN-binding domain
MKKILAICLILISTIGFGACSGGSLTDGMYDAEGTGNGGKLEVKLKVAGGKIEEVTIGDNDETPAMLKMVEETLLDQIVEKQGVKGVDTVSGATKTSEGVLEAVGLALEEASK